MLTNATMGTGNLPKVIIAVVVSVFFSGAFVCTGQAMPTAGQQENGKQAQQTTVPTSDSTHAAQKAAEDATKAANEAKEADPNSQNAQKGAETAAGNAQTARSNAAQASSDAAFSAQTATKKALQADTAAGIALNGSTNVKDNVTAQVVLLPRKQAERSANQGSKRPATT